MLLQDGIIFCLDYIWQHWWMASRSHSTKCGFAPTFSKSRWTTISLGWRGLVSGAISRVLSLRRTLVSVVPHTTRSREGSTVCFKDQGVPLLVFLSLPQSEMPSFIHMRGNDPQTRDFSQLHDLYKPSIVRLITSFFRPISIVGKVKSQVDSLVLEHVGSIWMR